jgi:uncharacterized protein (DUF433 family)
MGQCVGLDQGGWGGELGSGAWARRLRFPAARLLGLLAAGATRAAILADRPYLVSDDIDEALRHAAFRPDDETIQLVG